MNALRPVRIAFVTSGLRLGGAERMLLRLVTGLDRARFEPSVFSLSGEGNLTEALRHSKIAVYAWQEAELVSIIRILRELHRSRFDLIHGWMYRGNLVALAAMLGQKPQTKLIWGIRASLDNVSSLGALSRIAARTCGWLSGFPSSILYNSTRSRSQHQSLLGYRSMSERVIENGFDCDEFSPNAQARTELRQQLGLAIGAPVVGLFARYHPMKDHETFLKAAALVVQKRPDARFVLAGTNVSPSNQELRQQISGLGIENHVQLLGPLADPAPFYRVLDVFGLTSNGVEGFPNVVGEAMASGVPCVVTDVGDSAQIVGTTGLVVSARDPSRIAEAWLRLIELKPDAKLEMATAARERIQKMYSLETIVSRYEAHYLSIAVAREAP